MDRHYDYCSCGRPKKKTSEKCRKCKPSYVRTQKHRDFSRQLHLGKKKNYPSASTRPEIAEKIRQAWTPEMKEAARQRGLEKRLDPEWRRMIGESVSGEKSGTWENGRSQIPYAPGWGRVNRQIIWEKQHGLCQNCGEQKPLDTHHKDGSKSNHAEDNLVGLCRKCHKQAHADLRKNHLSSKT